MVDCFLSTYFRHAQSNIGFYDLTEYRTIEQGTWNFEVWRILLFTI